MTRWMGKVLFTQLSSYLSITNQVFTEIEQSHCPYTHQYASSINSRVIFHSHFEENVIIVREVLVILSLVERVIL